MRIFRHDRPEDMFLGEATQEEADRWFKGVRGDWYRTLNNLIIYRFGNRKYEYTCGYAWAWECKPDWRFGNA